MSLLSLHAHCFTQWVVFLCQVLSPDSTVFDQGCVHHPHVSTAFEQDKHGLENLCNEHSVRARVCVCALYGSQFISNTWFLLGVQLREKTLLVVCLCVCVCWCVFVCALTAFEPVLALTKNAQGTKQPPLLLEHRPCSRCLTGAEGKHQRHPDTRT